MYSIQRCGIKLVRQVGGFLRYSGSLSPPKMLMGMNIDDVGFSAKLFPPKYEITNFDEKYHLKMIKMCLFVKF